MASPASRRSWQQSASDQSCSRSELDSQSACWASRWHSAAGPSRFDGLWAPLNLNLLAIFVSLGIVITATLAFGLEPFIASVIGDAMALAGAAVLIALNAVVGGALAVISTLAARDADSEDDFPYIPNKSS